MSFTKCFPCLQNTKNEDDITELDLSNTLLLEEFPPVWQCNSSIEELNLSSTRITHLPLQLFYCQSIKILVANNNSLSNLSESIGSLKQLKHLSLNRNFIKSLPEQICSCKQLTYLDLSCNNLQRLPDAITSLLSLQELILNETCLEFLPANFGRLINLRIVELRLNNLIALPKSMARLGNLQRLDIGGNEFTELPDVIGELKQLRELWLDYNQIKFFPLSIGKLRDLRHLEANGNYIEVLPNEISSWGNLEVMSICGNTLSSFPFSIGMLISIVTLKCESNGLSELPDSILNLQNLEELVINDNKLKRLPRTIGMLKKLRYIFADGNELRTLPDELCNCHNLSVLSVSRNKLSELPQNIGHLSQLKVLNIVQNHINTLPVSILSLVNLTSLWISNNQSQPLVPLQYTDIGVKDQLTCFMLPQEGSKYYNADQQQTQQQKQLQQSQTKIGSENYDLSNNSLTTSRHICFAKQDTILCSPSNDENLEETSMYMSNNKTTSTPSKSFIKHCKRNLNEDAVKYSVISKDVLMRSPTLYPKELRLIAKYIRNSQKLSPSSSLTTSLINIEDVINKNQLKKSISQYATPFFHHRAEGLCYEVIHNAVDSRLHDSQGHPINDEDTIFFKPLDVSTREDDNFITYTNDQYDSSLMKNDNYKNSRETPTHVPANIVDVTCTEANVNLNDSPTISPPPYHIARCFTKKTQKDLSKYEAIRRNQIENLTNDSYSYLDKDSTVELMPDTIGHSNENTSCQRLSYDLTNEQHAPATEQYNSENPKIENLSVQILNTNNSTKKSNSLSPAIEGQMKYKTPWLFGTHKNTTVMQVTIKWQIEKGFEIGRLLNEDGLYIISVLNESNAARLLCLGDKLLEINGHDFTSITLEEGRSILDKSPSTLNIMLSRK